MDPLLSPYPAPPPARPAVLGWFKAYCVVLCLLYLLFAGASLIFFLVEPEELEMGTAEAIFMGLVFLVVGLVCFVASLLPLFLKPRPWVWIYDLVVICIGMTSACFLPLCVPLLIFWIKPEVKAWFGRK
ncbi:MAG: hypothetical protein KGR69_03185 [Verrucomicrobia bacterium]|nr:hypothetical protein [Verrucomicrobiota bacterium]